MDNNISAKGNASAKGNTLPNVSTIAGKLDAMQELCYKLMAQAGHNRIIYKVVEMCRMVYNVRIQYYVKTKYGIDINYDLSISNSVNEIKYAVIDTGRNISMLSIEPEPKRDMLLLRVTFYVGSNSFSALYGEEERKQFLDAVLKLKPDFTDSTTDCVFYWRLDKAKVAMKQIKQLYDEAKAQHDYNALVHEKNKIDAKLKLLNRSIKAAKKRIEGN